LLIQPFPDVLFQFRRVPHGSSCTSTALSLSVVTSTASLLKPPTTGALHSATYKKS
jgi:hypothetical protein